MSSTSTDVFQDESEAIGYMILHGLSYEKLAEMDQCPWKKTHLWLWHSEQKKGYTLKNPGKQPLMDAEDISAFRVQNAGKAPPENIRTGTAAVLREHLGDPERKFDRRSLKKYGTLLFLSKGAKESLPAAKLLTSAALPVGHPLVPMPQEARLDGSSKKKGKKKRMGRLLINNNVLTFKAPRSSKE